MRDDDLRDDGFGNLVPADEAKPAGGDDGLRFDKVEPAAAGDAQADAPRQDGSSCQACGRALGAEYFEVNAAMVCGDCVEEIRRSMAPRGSRAGRFSKAVLAGAGVGVLGSIVWYAVGKLTGYELSLIAIAIGWGVGWAVRWGSGHRGGWRYQTIAVVLTYLSIVGSYMPQIAAQLAEMPAEGAEGADGADGEAASEATPEPALAEAAAEPLATPDAATSDAATADAAAADAATADAAVGAEAGALGLLAFGAVLLVIAMAAPFFAGFENVMGLLIIAIGLWQAWAMNRRGKIAISGPYLLGSRAPA